MTYVDSHSHLADPRLDASRTQIIQKARACNIQTFIQGGVGPDDWQKQLELAQQIPGLVPVLGLHPYWVAAHSEMDCESALDQLARMLANPKVKALGELGLDFRPSLEQFDGVSSKARQLTMFEMQLEMAKMAQKPLVLHLVRAFDEGLRCLTMWGPFSKGGMVHSFNGTLPQAKEYLDLGLHISVGGPLCREDNARLHQAVAGIPLEFLLLETDTPDQAPPGLEINENSSLLLVANKVAEIKKLKPDEVLDRTSENAKKLFSL